MCAHYSSKNIYTEIVRSEAGWSRIGSSYYHEFEIGSGRVLQRSYRRRSTGNDYYHTFDKLVSPIFEIVRPIPPIAWIPLSIIWLGVGTTAKAFIIFLAAFVPCVINSHTGIKLTPAVYLNVAKTSGASRWEIFWTVSKNYAMPLAFTGVQVALGNAWSTLVASELLAATAGLGYMIQQGRSLVRPDIIIVGMLTIGVIGAILTTLLSKLENHVVKWRSRG